MLHIPFSYFNKYYPAFYDNKQILVIDEKWNIIYYFFKVLYLNQSGTLEYLVYMYDPFENKMKGTPAYRSL